MKRLMAIVMLLGAMGCSNDYYALRIIQPDASAGRICQELSGSDEQALKQRRIDYAIECAADDGIKISAWAIKAQTPARSSQPSGGANSQPATGANSQPAGGAPTQPAATVVLLHGMGEGKAIYLGVARRLSARGLNAVLIDLRAHGCSGGKYVTYGAKEKHDVMAVLDCLAQRGLAIGDVYAFGATLGGAAAIQYAAIDPRCKGVVAVAPYKDARSIARWIVFFHAPTMSEANFARTLARAGQLADFDPDEASAVAAAGKFAGPMLLVHGLLDLSVPLDHSQAIYDSAGGPRKLIIVTPGPEQLALGLVWEDWLADRLAELARGNLDGYASPKPAAKGKP